MVVVVVVVVSEYEVKVEDAGERTTEGREGMEEYVCKGESRDLQTEEGGEGTC